jgi:WD40 repeat protein
VRKLDPLSPWARAVAFSSDGARVAAGSVDGTIRVFDVASGRLVWGPISGHRSTIWSLAYSPTQPSRFVTGGSDQFMRVWTEGEQRPVFESDVHDEWVNGVSFSRDGDRILSVGADATARVWRFVDHASDGDPRRLPEVTLLSTYEVPSRSNAGAFSPDGDAIAIASDDGIGRVFPLDSRAWFAIGCDLLRGLPEYEKVASICR